MNVSPAVLMLAVALAAVFLLPAAGVAGDATAFGSRRRWVSAAAGVSVAYVFMDVLPELDQLNDVLVRSGYPGAFLAEQRIYLLALLSFIFLYGLQHYVLQSRSTEEAGEASGGPDRAYRLQLAGFAAYAALIGYLLVERAAEGPAALATYAVAMAIHFVIVNHSLGEGHEEVYRRRGRWLLAASVVAGCVAGLWLQLADVAFARLFALLAGGVVLTSLQAELPDDRRGRFWPFCLGALIYATLLMRV